MLLITRVASASDFSLDLVNSDESSDLVNEMSKVVKSSDFSRNAKQSIFFWGKYCFKLRQRKKMLSDRIKE